MLLRFRPIGLLLVALSLPPASLQAQVSAPFCLGNSCPCGNDDPNAGCGNAGLDGDSLSGARLIHSAGSTNVFADDLVLTLDGLSPNKFGLILIGSQTTSNPLGDGVLCIQLGSAGNQRPPVQLSGESGSFSQSNFVADSQTLLFNPIVAGTQLHFQGYYRDPGGPCGLGFNLSNALTVNFTAGPIETELAGQALPEFPHINFVNVFNELTSISATIDPDLHPQVLNQSAMAYVVDGRTRSEWDADPSLVDARGGATPVTFAGVDVAGNTFELDGGSLATPTDARLSAGYDVVIDLDGDGLLSDGDFIDGRGDEDGLTVYRDPVALGPYSTIEAIHDHGGAMQRQRIYYPTNISSLGQLPLVIVSHGNGHNFGWYDHIGEHMASWGYVVMAHQNNTMPGSNAASVTTLDNTDVFIGNLAAIEGGALVGHVDVNRIVWMGHSRGAEGIAIAYHKVFTGSFVPVNFTVDDIRLLTSIAPTDFTGPNLANPHDVPFQLLVGAADDDVTGEPSPPATQPYHLLTRATGQRMSVTYHGVGHGAFHDGQQGLVAAGPCIVGRGNTHRLMLGYLLPTLRHVVDGKAAAEEFLWRPWQSLKPIDAPAAACPDVCYEYWNGPDPSAFVIDDFESEPSEFVSSSGGSLALDLVEWGEGVLQDGDGMFEYSSLDVMNGMTRNAPADDERGLVFQWSGMQSLEFEIVPQARNFTERTFLSFRACQMSRHPFTTVELADMEFQVTLRDGHGRTSTIEIAAYGSGIIEPYQRTGSGLGAGWANEFETTRIRLSDFIAGGAELDLTDVVALRFEFGEGDQPQFGRMGLDDIELVQE